MLYSYGLLILVLFSSALHAQESSPSGETPYVDQQMALIYFPSQLSFWNMTYGESARQEVFLRQGDEHTFSIKSIESSSDFLVATHEDTGGVQKRTYTVNVTLSAEAPVGSFAETLTIVTDHPKHSTIKLPIYGNILDGIALDPQAFGIKLNYFKRQGMGMIRITSTGNSPFEVKGISSSYPPVKAALVAGEECCSHIIGVVIRDPEKKINKPTRATLHVETTSSQGLIVIPVLIDVPSL